MQTKRRREKVMRTIGLWRESRRIQSIGWQSPSGACPDWREGWAELRVRLAGEGSHRRGELRTSPCAVDHPVKAGRAASSLPSPATPASTRLPSEYSRHASSWSRHLLVAQQPPYLWESSDWVCKGLRGREEWLEKGRRIGTNNAKSGTVEYNLTSKGKVGECLKWQMCGVFVAVDSIWKWLELQNFLAKYAPCVSLLKEETKK